MERILDIFKDKKGKIMGNYKRNAVMIALIEEEGEIRVVFEVRALQLRHQPGDICLPGGKIEEGESAKEAAIRETLEELNLEAEDIELLGEMDYLITPYGSILYPFVAKLKKKNIQPSKAEVDHIFTVPLSFFIEEEPIFHEIRIGPHLTSDFPYHLIKGGANYKFSEGKLQQYFYKYNQYVIWGFTARIIKEFIALIKENFKN